MSNRRINRPQNDVVPKIRVSPKLASGMTDYRKNQLEDAIENGLISEGGQNYANSNLKRGASEQAGNPASDKLVRGAWENSYERSGVINKSGNPSMGAIVHSSSFYENQEFILRKKASVVTSGSTSSSVSGQTSFDRMVPEVYSPLFTMANLNLPRDRLTINAWIRNYYDLNPIVRNAITLHATYPISKLNIKCQDRKVLQFFEDMVEEMDLLHTLGMVSLEFWKLGEVFPYAELNESSGKWSKIVVQNPDYILVKRSALAGQPIISMRPDEVLRRLALSNNPADVHLRKQIPEKILHYVRQGKDIPLDNFNISHLKMLSSPYDLRGQSIIVSIFKDLSLYDKLRECKFAQADGLVNPVTVIKVGGNSDGDYRATQEDLEHYRQIFEEAEFDKNAKIITHAGVTVERVGASGATLDVAGDIEHIVKNIYTGLMVPPAIIDTESAVYASASIGLEVLRQRYFNFRNMIAKWLQNKIFAPISEIQEFWEYKDGKKKLIVPEIEWNQMNLYDLQDYIGNITGLLSQKQVSLQTVYRSLGLNYEEERVKIRQESINDMIKVKEEQALAQMTLTELRGVDPEKDILEPVDSEQREAEAGVGAGAAGMGGEAVPGGMPNLGGGPELGGPEAGGMPELSPPAPELPAGGAPAGGPPSLGPGM